jgi:hypothetical protein
MYLCTLAGRYVEKGCRTGPPCWESIPELLKRFTNSGVVYIWLAESITWNRFLGIDSRILKSLKIPSLLVRDCEVNNREEEHGGVRQVNFLDDDILLWCFYS